MGQCYPQRGAHLLGKLASMSGEIWLQLFWDAGTESEVDKTLPDGQEGTVRRMG